jgi:hypothetical protein
MKSRLFERILELTSENYNKIIEDEEAVDKLYSIKIDKPGMQFVGLTGPVTGFNALKRVTDWDKSYLFMSGDDVVGACGMLTRWTRNIDFPNLFPIRKGDGESVWDYMLIGLRENSVTLVRDMISLVDQHIKEYDFVSWTVRPENPAKRMYDKYISRWNGVVLGSTRGKTRYIVKEGVDLSQYQEQLNDLPSED